MHHLSRAAFTAALMLAATPAAADFDQLYLEGDYVMWDQPPPVPVGRVDDPNLFEKLPTDRRPSCCATSSWRFLARGPRRRRRPG